MDMHLSDRSEQKIRQMYERVIREAKIVAWEYDSELHRLVIVSASEDSYTKKAGIPQVVNDVPESLLSYIDPGDRDAFLKMYRDIDEGKPGASCDVLFSARLHAESRYVHMAMTNLLDDKGKQIRAFGFGQDISWAKKEERIFQKLETKMAQMVSDSFATILMNITENQILRFESSREEYRQYYGALTVDDFFHRVGREIIQDDLRREFFATINRHSLMEAFRAGQDTIVKEYPLYSLRGRLCWVRSTLTMRRNPRSSALEAVAYAQDMTQEKIREELFAKISRARYNFIATLDISSRKINFFSGPDRNILEGRELPIGYEECVQLFLKERVVPEEQAVYLANADFKKMLSALEQKGRYRLEYRRSEGGEEQEFLTEFTWLQQEYGLIAIFCTDVTELRKEEKARIEKAQGLQLQAESASDAKMEFISRITHDIRTPIAAIQGLTDLALEDIEDPEKLRYDLENIRSSGKFLQSLVRDVLDVSRIDSGRIELFPEPFKKKHAITDIAKLFEVTCSQKGIIFVADPIPKYYPVMADRTRLRQIILNLISNAERYTPEGGMIRYSVRQEKTPDGRIAMSITVQDTGIGMSEEYVARCFEPFSQDMDNPNRRDIGGGTGLGLYIVHQLVTLMDGKLRVKSKEGAGTEITCSFLFPPAVKDGTSAWEPEDEHPDYLCGRVLLVEDNLINTRIALRMLEHLGASVDCAADGEEAVRIFRDSVPGTYRLVLMDIQMPRMNGYEATAAIRQSHRPDSATVPIYAMTANAFFEAERQGLLAGMNGYITKPIDRKKLAEVLHRCLGSVPEE